MKFERFVSCTDVKDVFIKLYNTDVEAKLLIDDIISEDWEDIGFDSFINTACSEALWEILDMIADESEIKQSIEKLLIFDEPDNKYNWEQCEGFASKKDFNQWWYGR